MARIGYLVLLVTAAWLGSPVLADEFDRIEGSALAQLARGADARTHRQLTIRELDALPAVLRDSRSALLLVTTDQDNYARLLVSAALRKSPEGTAQPVPVLVLERFDVFEAGNIATRLAHGKDLILFAGFQIDLDTGQVVPDNQGGDLRFVTDGESGPRVVAAGKAAIYTLTKPISAAAGDATRPSLGRAVLPTDFNGRYRLFSNGQWSGALELKVADDLSVTGRFRSDLNGTAYPVAGQVAADIPQKITFSIKYPRTRQEFDGLLWTEGKGAMAGTMTMINRSFGFFAVREGAQVAPEGEDVGPPGKGDATPHRKTVVFRKGQYTLDGQARTDLELTEALKRAAAAEPKTWVLLQVAEDEPYSAVRQAFEIISAAGITTIRVGPAD
jgi:hypothetical protein